ncbi:YdeI/OmpD-associated family protein [Microbacterium sp. STN6]|uniref:YdeI/OmpD-associated family protein n=1 Tax=Microbacterium sp. STN6 TaxID=2995588 RepID=UPI002260867B|nr:YdeI/OmpD-associated family protein [Microbacterium sp. STN6]MCX7522068.1 YdeI/OmpD-associated family protein [Microbacterium sp. STN6]
MPTFTATIHSNGGSTAGIEVPADVVAALGGGKRPLVTVTLDGRYSFSYTVGVMSGRTLIGLSAAHRAASGLAVGDKVTVDVELDAAPREVAAPTELAEAFATDPALKTAWEKLSFTNRKEHARSIEDAKAPETRARRVDKALAALRDVKEK